MAPQFLFDPYLVDNHWALKITSEAFERVLHSPRKFEANPVIPGQGGSPGVVRGDDGTFRIWYQVWDPGDGPRTSKYSIAYAESSDGQTWQLPELGLNEWQGTTENNIVISDGGRANAPFLLDVPESARRGFRYVLLYNSRQGMMLAGSHDGIHWNDKDKICISPIHSDTQNAIVYDAARQEFVAYCRAKQLYLVHGRGDVVDVGESRRIARMASKEPLDAVEVRAADDPRAGRR